MKERMKEKKNEGIKTTETTEKCISKNRRKKIKTKARMKKE